MLTPTLRAACRTAATLSVFVGVPRGAAQFVEPDAAALHVIDGEGGGFGWAVSALADIDGDGIGDFLTGAPNLTTASGAQAGRLYAYSGRLGSLIRSFDGPAARSNLGYSMADAGDTDGDGVHDILGGAKGAQGATSPGNAYLYSGADGALRLTLTGDEIGEAFGHAVAGIGDVDGDGRGDVLVGSPSYDGALGANAGRAYVFSGADGSRIRVHESTAMGDQLGSGTAGIGDVNGDGVPDYAVGAKRAGPDDRGACFVYSGSDGSTLLELVADASGNNFGQFFVGPVGDFDADGTPDIYVGDFSDGSGAGRAYVFSGADGSQLFNAAGEPGSGLGCGRGAGDVNGDGHADLAVGAYSYSAPNGAGRVYLFSGCDGRILRTITSDRGSNEQLGFDAVGVMDFDGDSYPEILAAAGAGDRIYVVRGNRHPIPDFNADGRVDTQDVIALLNAWVSGSPDADYNVDGSVNTQDVIAFLNAWVAGC